MEDEGGMRGAGIMRVLLETGCEEVDPLNGEASGKEAFEGDGSDALRPMAEEEPAGKDGGSASFALCFPLLRLGVVGPIAGERTPTLEALGRVGRRVFGSWYEVRRSRGLIPGGVDGKAFEERDGISALPLPLSTKSPGMGW